MSDRKPAFFIVLLTGILAVFYIIIVYLEASWSVKIPLLVTCAVLGLAFWRRMKGALQAPYSIVREPWSHIHKILQGVEQTDTYVLCLGNSNQYSCSSRSVIVREGVTYLNITNPEHLVGMVDKLLIYLPKKILKFSIELSLFPALSRDDGVVLKDWLRNILFLQNYLNANVPVNIVLHMPINSGRSVLPCCTLGLKGGVTEADICRLIQQFKQVLGESFVKYCHSSNNNHYISLIHILSYLEEILSKQVDMGWSYINVRSITVAMDGSGDNQSLWFNYFKQTTGGLVFPFESGAHEVLYYTPVSLLNKNTVYRRNMVIDVGFKVLSIIALTFLVASSFSTINNSRLLERINQHISDFKKYSDKSAEETQFSVRQLQQDLQLLKKYQNEGIPANLGLGLYRAQLYIPELEKNLASIKSITPKPDPVKSVVLTLDSLALFDSGQYELKSNANKALIGALRAIEAQPATQVLIEGHTDNIGNPASNQQLSEKRALAVRDWLVESSNISINRFATKGWGHSKPVAENNSEEGRAKNRRVEIILIPNEIITQP